MCKLLSGETTSENFDKRPLGFRLWEVDAPLEATMASVIAPQGLAPSVPLLIGLMDGTVLRG